MPSSRRTCRAGKPTGRAMDINCLRGWSTRGRTECVGVAVRPTVQLGGHGDNARRGERLVEVGDDVVDMLDAYGETDITLGDATGVVLLQRVLGMGGGGRMNGTVPG